VRATGTFTFSTTASRLSRHLINEKIPVIYQRTFEYYRRTWGELLPLSGGGG
jgi:hypothetical protein